MVRFLVDFLVFGAITVASTVPLVLVGRRLKRRINHKKWLWGAAIVSLASAALGYSSRSLQESCLKEYNDGCVDIGGAGTQFMIIAGFVFWALLSAYLRWNDY